MLKLLLISGLLLCSIVGEAADRKSEPRLTAPQTVVVPKLKYYRKSPEMIPPEIEEENNRIAVKHLENCYSIAVKLRIDTSRLSKSEKATMEFFISDDLVNEIQQLCIDNIVRSEDF